MTDLNLVWVYELEFALAFEGIFIIENNRVDIELVEVYHSTKSLMLLILIRFHFEGEEAHLQSSR